MSLQVELFHRIVNGGAGEAAPLMARVALHIGHDARTHPVSLEEICQIGRMPGDPDTAGFNELLIADYLKAAIHGLAAPWDGHEVAQLRAVANMGGAQVREIGPLRVV